MKGSAPLPGRLCPLPQPRVMSPPTYGPLMKASVKSILGSGEEGFKTQLTESADGTS